MSPHKHKCHACGNEFACLGVGKGKICEVDKAAKSNGRGPYCLLCYFGMMFLRLCDSQKIVPDDRLQALEIHEREVPPQCQVIDGPYGP